MQSWSRMHVWTKTISYTNSRHSKACIQMTLNLRLACTVSLYSPRLKEWGACIIYTTKWYNAHSLRQIDLETNWGQLRSCSKADQLCTGWPCNSDNVSILRIYVSLVFLKIKSLAMAEITDNPTPVVTDPYRDVRGRKDCLLKICESSGGSGTSICMPSLFYRK